MYSNYYNFETYRAVDPPRRDGTGYCPPEDSDVCEVFHSTGVLNSGRSENLYGRIPDQDKNFAYKYLLDGPNFLMNQTVRIRNLLRTNLVESGKMTWFGDKAMWVVDREIICAGSLMMKNELSQHYDLRDMKVRVRPIHVSK